MVKLKDTVDGTQAKEIPLMPADEYSKMWGRFFKVTNRNPREDEEPSQQQLTGLVHFLMRLRCYVDFAIWCAHHFRTLKDHACQGLIPGPL